MSASYEVTLDVEGMDPFVHRCTAGSEQAAAEFTAQVFLLGRDRSSLVGRKIEATVEPVSTSEDSE